MTALEVPFLGEHVGWLRRLAISIGMLGVMMVLRPFEYTALGWGNGLD